MVKVETKEIKTYKDGKKVIAKTKSMREEIYDGYGFNNPDYHYDKMRENKL